MGVGRLTDVLRSHFAPDQVFQDISSIQPGADFVKALEQAFVECAAVLVVIGPRWLTVTDREGHRRLDDPNDWVRQEVAAALGRPDLPVFPLLVDGALMPRAEDLPEPLRSLTRRQAHELTFRHWAKDVAVLIETLKRIPSLSPTAGTTRDTRSHRRFAAWSALGIGAALAAGFVVWKAELPHLVTTMPGQVQSESNEAAAPRTAPSSIAAPKFNPSPSPSMAQPSATVQPTPKPTLAEQQEVGRQREESATRAMTQPVTDAVGKRTVPEALTSSMVNLPGNCFEMGSPTDEAGHNEDERQHRACVDAFALSKTEVTQAQWTLLMGKNPSKSECADCPVENVSWKDATAFIEQLNALTGQRYRLPTEAEWEYACRGGRSDERYCGGNDLDAVGWYDKNSLARVHPVAQKQPNGFGLYDMSGNVWEWTCSGFDKGYSGGERQCARGALTYVLRGGAWTDGSRNARSARRLTYAPAYNYFFGFRLARTL